MVQILVWAGANRPTLEGAQVGDIIAMLEDGQHPGLKVVTGSTWSDPADYSTTLGRALTPAEMQSGTRPDFNIVDIPGVTIAQARTAFGNRVAEVLGLAIVPRRLKDAPKIAKIDPAQLPLAARNSLRDDGRVTSTGAQLWAVLMLKDGVTLEKIRAWVTRNEQEPSEWTTAE